MIFIVYAPVNLDIHIASLDAILVNSVKIFDIFYNDFLFNIHPKNEVVQVELRNPKTVWKKCENWTFTGCKKTI